MQIFKYKKAIITLFEDKKLLERYQNQARITAEAHSAKYFAEQILDVYKIAIKNKPKHKIALIDKVHNLITNEEEENEENEKTNNTES